MALEQLMAKLFLGLDSSTQSLSAVVIDLNRRNRPRQGMRRPGLQPP
jgi:sugar (pentulose or hexulose) kinase